MASMRTTAVFLQLRPDHTAPTPSNDAISAVYHIGTKLATAAPATSTPETIKNPPATSA